MLVDVHCHLYFPQFEKDFEEVIKRAESVGLVSIINAGTDHDSNVTVLGLSKKYKIINATLGLYPTEALEISDEELDKELDFIKSHKDNIVGIGEVGLDFQLTTEPEQREKQIKVFKKLITELKPLNKTFVIHSRKAEKQCIEILEELEVKKVNFHCFSGNFKLAKRIEQNNWTMSIPANIGKSEHFQGIVKQTSINNLLTETDSPFLSPVGEERSEPSFVKQTIKKIAEIKDMDVKEVTNNIFLNYQKSFS
ncbi:TatD family hydrolase [Candidatus Woesearchaeota archaeon]|jgi:TatD DNase family protein|nr:TatD family hydrolase [Candidatus Woesearchaeota archaeon]MBT5215707.1 TatD family hydrolase [Candidatus Woesearchaeota archaeon]